MGIRPQWASAWEQLDFPQDDLAFHRMWMDLFIRTLVGPDNLREAVLVWRQLEPGAYRPQATWPTGQGCSMELAQACEQALLMRTHVSRQGLQAALAFPVLDGADVLGVIGLGLSRSDWPADMHDRIRWGIGWLLQHHAQQDSKDRELLREQLMRLVDMMLLGLSQTKAVDAAQSVLGELAQHLRCERVSLGWARGQKQVRLFAMSNVADFSRHLELNRQIEAAMDEALDQGKEIHCPNQQQAVAAVETPPAREWLRAHEQLQQSTRHGRLLTLPLALESGCKAAFVFEWEEGAELSVAELGFARHAVAVLARILHARVQAQRGLPERLEAGLREQCQRMFGPRYPVRKGVALAGLVVALFFAIAQGDFEVPAQATLEGSIRRQVVAPFDGYVAAADKRAGEVVVAGTTLAQLDDRDIKLESAKWASQEQQYAQQMSEAQAQKNLAQIQITLAQTRQADAQHALSQSMLERTRVVAPFAGVLVSGDLSQQLGAAVRKGQLLFEIAPLEGYRVVLQVDESDIAHIQAGQKGRLVLTAMPTQVLNFVTTLVTPVAEARDGKNLFRVEARLDNGLPQLRPGMEGVGKVVVGQNRLIWIWTRRFTDWLRLQAWSWLGV